MSFIIRKTTFFRFIAALSIISSWHQARALTLPEFTKSPLFWASCVVTSGSVLAGSVLGCALAIGSNYYRNYAEKKALKNCAMQGYYEPSCYQKLVTDNCQRHIPLVIGFDTQECTRTDGNAAITRLVADTIELVADVSMPVCIITTPSVLRNGRAKSLFSQQHTDLFMLFDLRSKGADLILLVPKKFDNNLLQLFNIEGLERFDGDYRTLIPWLMSLERRACGRLYNDAIGQIFAQHDIDVIWDIFISGHGYPSTYGETLGIEHQQVQSLLALLNTKVHVGVVYLSSCYLPGHTMHAIVPTKADGYMQSLHYPLMVNGVYDATVWGMGGDAQISQQHALGKFFNHAAMIADKGTSLDSLLGLLTDTDNLTVNIPQTLLPGQTTYYVLGKHPKVLSLGSVLHQRMLCEQQPLQIEQEVVLIYPTTVDVPLHVHGFKSSTQALNRQKRRPECANEIALLPRHEQLYRYPQFVCMQQEQRLHDQQITFGDIVLHRHPEADCRTSGVFAFISDAFKTFNKRADHLTDDQQRQYYIASLTGMHDIIHWFNAMHAVHLSEGNYKSNALYAKDAGKEITLHDIYINHYKRGLFSPAFTTIQFSCAADRYSMICTDTQIYWTVKPDVACTDTSLYMHDIIMAAQRYNLRDRAFTVDRAVAPIKRIVRALTPARFGSDIQRVVQVAEQRMAPRVCEEIIYRLLRDNQLVVSKESGDFVQACMQRVIAHPALADRMLVGANIVELIEQKFLSLDMYEAYLATLLAKQDEVDVHPLFELVQKNLYMQEIAAMLQRLASTAPVHKIEDVLHLWACLALKQAVAFKDILAFATCADSRRSLLEQIVDLPDAIALQCTPDELLLLADAIPVMLELSAQVGDEREHTTYVIPAIEQSLELLLKHGALNQEQANALLAQAQNV
jgi:hypothetical protein